MSPFNALAAFAMTRAPEAVAKVADAAGKAADKAANQLAGNDNGEPLWLWLVFAAIVVASLVIDLNSHKSEDSDTTKNAAIWSCIWIGTAVIFGLAVWPIIGTEHVSQYFTAYLLEKSLSVDNLFVFLVIFTFFQVAPHQQRRVLFWGILGALVMRALFIFLGVEALLHFKWLFYVFGAFLVFTGVKLFKGDDDEVKPEENFFYKLALKHLPICDSDSTHFIHKENGRTLVTKLFVVLIVIETTDLMFAVDSIPAVVAVSQDMFVVYTSNIFAILGLRALYFLLSGIMRHLRYLNLGLGVVLSFIGVKMILACEHADFFGLFTIPGFGVEIPSTVSLGIICAILLVAVVASLMAKNKEGEETKAEDGSSKPAEADASSESSEGSQAKESEASKADAEAHGAAIATAPKEEEPSKDGESADKAGDSPKADASAAVEAPAPDEGKKD